MACVLHSLYLGLAVGPLGWHHEAAGAALRRQRCRLPEVRRLRPRPGALVLAGLQVTLAGNSAFHSQLLYRELVAAVPKLSRLLTDAEEKTRANAAGAWGHPGGVLHHVWSLEEQNRP